MDGDEIDASDIPDECSWCEEDLGIERRTGVEILYTARKAVTYEAHMRDEHPVIWWVAGKITRVTQALRQLKP